MGRRFANQGRKAENRKRSVIMNENEDEVNDYDTYHGLRSKI